MARDTEKIIIPTDNYITFEVQGIPLHCGNEEDHLQWFADNKSGWYNMKLVEATEDGSSCGFGGVPATMTTIKMSGSNMNFVPTSH